MRLPAHLPEVTDVPGACGRLADKYTLKSPSGGAFSDFRGYEDWAVVSSARTDKELKVIVANPALIQAYKAGVPGNDKPFPEGAKIAKQALPGDRRVGLCALQP